MNHRWEPQNLPFRICSIDPGTAHMGISIIDVDMLSWQRSVVNSNTYRSDVGGVVNPLTAEVHGDRIARHQFHRMNLKGILEHFRPHSVIAESPFMGRFAGAFEALVECRTNIRFAVMEYDPTMHLELVDPPSAKMACGCSGKADKDQVRDALLAMKGLLWAPDIMPELLDEHSTDSIAVGLYKAMQLQNEHMATATS